MRVFDVLELAPTALRNVGTGRPDPVRRRRQNADHLREAHLALAVAQRDLHVFTGDAALHHDRRAIVVAGQTQSAVDHAPEVRQRASRSRSIRLTS